MVGFCGGHGVHSSKASFAHINGFFGDWRRMSKNPIRWELEFSGGETRHSSVVGIPLEASDGRS